MTRTKTKTSVSKCDTDERTLKDGKTVRPEAKPIKAKAHTKPVRGCLTCDFIVIMDDKQQGYCQVHGDINGGPSDEW